MKLTLAPGGLPVILALAGLAVLLLLAAAGMKIAIAAQSDTAGAEALKTRYAAGVFLVVILFVGLAMAIPSLFRLTAMAEPPLLAVVPAQVLSDALEDRLDGDADDGGGVLAYLTAMRERASSATSSSLEGIEGRTDEEAVFGNPPAEGPLAFELALKEGVRFAPLSDLASLVIPPAAPRVGTRPLVQLAALALDGGASRRGSGWAGGPGISEGPEPGGTGVPGTAGPGAPGGGPITFPDIPRPPASGGVDAEPPRAVPEPASWMVLLTGFLLTGLTLRRRQALTASA
ncbi:PEP-CTERM sorting domain-containing protein [Sphingomonas sp. ID0503]|uniref:PEP-CTERM sorting domain-containing protein n=1 Tax=Sphingomonas sp. ID0503 TaxID=3399691 RepID=UPI003AFAF02C